jgi:hypothetical protein
VPVLWYLVARHKPLAELRIVDVQRKRRLRPFSALADEPDNVRHNLFCGLSRSTHIQRTQTVSSMMSWRLLLLLAAGLSLAAATPRSRPDRPPDRPPGRLCTPKGLMLLPALSLGVWGRVGEEIGMRQRIGADAAEATFQPDPVPSNLLPFANTMYDLSCVRSCVTPPFATAAAMHACPQPLSNIVPLAPCHSIAPPCPMPASPPRVRWARARAAAARARPPRPPPPAAPAAPAAAPRTAAATAAAGARAG